MLTTSNLTEQEVLNQIQEDYNNLVIINKPDLTKDHINAIKDAISYSNIIGSDNDPEIIYNQLVFYHTEANLVSTEILDIMATIFFDLPFSEFHKTAEEKHLLSNSTVGGYPLVYFNSDEDHLCSECATKQHKEQHNIYFVEPNYDNKNIHCTECDKQIEPAYED